MSLNSDDERTILGDTLDSGIDDTTLAVNPSDVQISRSRPKASSSRRKSLVEYISAAVQTSPSISYGSDGKKKHTIFLVLKVI